MAKDNQNAAQANYGGMEPGESNARAVRDGLVTPRADRRSKVGAVTNEQAQELVDSGEATPGPAAPAPKPARSRKPAAPRASKKR